MIYLLRLSCAIAILFVSASAFGQCNPDPAFASSPFGIYPVGPMQMDCSGTNSNVTVVGLSDTIIEIIPNGSSATVYFDATRVDTVIGLPTGLSVETDVMDSANAESPYGFWTYTGVNPNFTPSIGCMNITGSASAWNTAATGGPNNDGEYPLTITIDRRVAYSNPDIAFIVPNGSWVSVTGNAELSADTVEVLLRVNESACSGDLSLVPAVTASADTSQGCTGSVTVDVYYGQPPYTYLFSNGTSGSSSVTGLCPGVYSVQVSDANGASGYAEFAIGMEANVYTNVPPGPVPLGTDSLFFTSGNCDLDYNLPVDSFSVVDAFAFGNDTIAATWVIYQLGNPYTVVSFYPDGNPQPTVLSLVVFCENGRAATGVFQLFEYVDLSVVTGISDNVHSIDFSVVPNPSNGLFRLVLDNNAGLNSVDVFDPTGKLVLTQNLSIAGNNQIDLQHLADGLYTLRVSSQNGFGVKRIVKAGGLR